MAGKETRVLLAGLAGARPRLTGRGPLWALKASSYPGALGAWGLSDLFASNPEGHPA
jgi:hypothetical protein